MASPDPRPFSFMHWLGRQIGHIRNAIRTDVTRTIVYRKETVEEHPAPADPNLTLRRTTTDEVVRSINPSADQR